MGFLKDITTLNRMGNDIRRNWDPAAQLAQSQAAMAQANAAMAEMANRASSTAALHGTPATASVVAARQTGQYINMQPLVTLDLLVQMPGGLPAPVTINEVVSQLNLSRVAPGASLPVKVGAAPGDVVVDWFRS